MQGFFQCYFYKGVVFVFFKCHFLDISECTHALAILRPARAEAPQRRDCPTAKFRFQKNTLPLFCVF